MPQKACPLCLLFYAQHEAPQVPHPAQKPFPELLRPGVIAGTPQFGELKLQLRRRRQAKGLSLCAR
jgi:hypothetical protein